MCGLTNESMSEEMSGRAYCLSPTHLTYEVFLYYPIDTKDNRMNCPKYTLEDRLETFQIYTLLSVVLELPENEKKIEYSYAALFLYHKTGLQRNMFWAANEICISVYSL